MADLRKIKDKAAELAAKGKLEKAAELYREALRGDAKDFATRQKLAEVLRRAGRIPEAIDSYRQVADRFAHDGLLIKAIAISKTILELDPDHVETQTALAELYARRAATEGARPPARTVVMSALRAPVAAPPVRPALVPPPPDPEDRVVEIPLGSPEPEAVPLESLLEPTITPGTAPALRAPPAAATPASPVPPPRAPAGAPPAAPPRTPPSTPTTPLGRIALAAREAEAAGIEEEIVIEAELLDDDLVAVGEDEPLTPPAPPLPTPPPPAPPQRAPAPPRAAPVPAPPPPRAAPRAPPPAPPAAPPPDRRLPRVPIFSDLSREAFVELTRAMSLRRANEGEVVIREGDDDTAFYVVASGRLAVSKRTERGEAVVLARLGEGDFFGEMALLSGAPRAATVIAEEPSELLEFRAETLLHLAGRHPHVAASVRRFYRQRLLANAMAVSPVFRPFGKGDRKLVMERFRARNVTEGEVVIREGEPSDGLYVILEGAVDVLKRRGNDEALVGQLREGDLFGEMSCLRKAPAAATITVRRAGTLLRLPRREFDELVVTHPQILELVSELSEERAENLDAILSGHAQWTDDGLVLV